MSNPPPLPPAERFANMLRWLSQAVAAQTGWGLSLHMIALLIDRLRGIKQRFASIAARIRDGKYLPRKTSATAHTWAIGRPVPPDPLPRTPGWLRTLLPQAANEAAASLRTLLADPEVAALIAAAPGPMRRPVRSLCRMLGVEPPAVLAQSAPARPAKARPAKPAPASTRPAPVPPPPTQPRPAAPPPPAPPPRPKPALGLEYVNGRLRLVWN
jgi:hypothetical protein